MQPFDHYYEKKMSNSDFKSLYEAECSVCANTMAIFEKIELKNICINTLARDVDTDPAKLTALRDADHCDPHLVIRLCRHLGLQVPGRCAKSPQITD